MALSTTRATSNGTDKVVAYILAALDEEVADQIDEDDLRENIEPMVQGIVESIFEELIANGVITVNNVTTGVSSATGGIG